MTDTLRRLVPGAPLRPWLALALGAALALAYAPFGLWPLALVLPAALLWLLDGESPRRAALTGFAFGLGWFGAGIHWIYVSLHDYGDAPPAFAALATLLVILLMAAYPALLGWVLNRLFPAPGPRRWLLAWPALWALLEWLRAWLFTGFPWLSPGYSQSDSWLAGYAPIAGVFGLGWMLLLDAGLLRCALAGRGRARAVALAALAALWLLGFGLQRIEWGVPAGSPLKLALVQGNVSQELKWRPEKLAETLTTYVELSERAGPRDLVVWPETAVPTFWERLEDGFVPALRDYAARTGTDFLIGTPAGDPARALYYNAVVSVGKTPGAYHKHRLLPFGEYLPLRGLLMVFRDFVQIPMADFTPGAEDQAILTAAGRPVGISICFEAAFGSEVRRALPRAELLVNVSNDAWFGDSLAPHQHLQIARMRALEAARPMARATNTGITALIDADGRVLAHAPQFEPAVLTGELQPRSGVTPYVALGDAPVAVLAGGLLLIGLLEQRRKCLIAERGRV